MAVTRTQGVEQIIASFPDVTITSVDVPRPQTSPAEPAYAENTDHVIAPPALREMEAGHVQIAFASTLLAAGVFLDRVEVRKLLPAAQKGIAGPGDAFFPSGAPADETLVRTLVDRAGADDLLLSDDSVVDLFGRTSGANTVRSYPGITLRSGEFLRLLISNQSGGALNDQEITAKYNLGLNQQDTGKP